MNLRTKNVPDFWILQSNRILPNLTETRNRNAQLLIMKKILFLMRSLHLIMHYAVFKDKARLSKPQTTKESTEEDL